MNISQQVEDIHSKEFQLFEDKLALVIQKAYERGVEEGKQLVSFENSLPMNLEKKHIAKIFNVKMPTVEKIIRMDGFPKCHAIAARYPKDKVLEWKEQNAMYMNDRLGIYVTEKESQRLVGSFSRGQSAV